MNFTNNLKKFIIENLLTEGLSKTLYHYTNLRNIIKIINSNKINLSSSLGTSADQFGTSPFFLSTTRSPQVDTGFDSHMPDRYRLVLDGEKLGHRFKGFPVDYWKKRSPNVFDKYNMNPEDKARRMKLDVEMEDRVISDKPYIENFNQYIKEIEILTDEEVLKKNLNIYKKLIEITEKNNIPVNIYLNKKDFRNKTNSVTSQIEGNENEYEERPDRENNWRLIDLFSIVLYEKTLAEDYDKFLPIYNQYNEKYNLESMGVSAFRLHEAIRYLMWNNDGIQSLQSELHNVFKSGEDNNLRKFSILLAKELKKSNTRNLNQLYQYKVWEIKPPHTTKKDYSNLVHIIFNSFEYDEENNRNEMSKEIPMNTVIKKMADYNFYVTKHNIEIRDEDYIFYNKLWEEDGTLKTFINYIFNKYLLDKAKRLLNNCAYSNTTIQYDV